MPHRLVRRLVGAQRSQALGRGGHPDTGGAHQDHPADPFGIIGRHLEGDPAAEGVADDRGASDALRVEERPHVIGPSAQRVHDVVRTLGGSESDDVGCQNVETSGQRADVELPIGRPGYAGGAGTVQHQHRFAGAGLEVARSDTAGINDFRRGDGRCHS